MMSKIVEFSWFLVSDIVYHRSFMFCMLQLEKFSCTNSSLSWRSCRRLRRVVLNSKTPASTMTCAALGTQFPFPKSNREEYLQNFMSFLFPPYRNCLRFRLYAISFEFCIKLDYRAPFLNPDWISRPSRRLRILHSQLPQVQVALRLRREIAMRRGADHAVRGPSIVCPPARTEKIPSSVDIIYASHHEYSASIFWFLEKCIIDSKQCEAHHKIFDAQVWETMWSFVYYYWFVELRTVANWAHSTIWILTEQLKLCHQDRCVSVAYASSLKVKSKLSWSTSQQRYVVRLLSQILRSHEVKWSTIQQVTSYRQRNIYFMFVMRVCDLFLHLPSSILSAIRLFYLHRRNRVV